jgi:phosphate transport system permease protein
MTTRASGSREIHTGVPRVRRARAGDRIFKGGSFAFAFGLIVLLGAILFVLADGSARIWAAHGLGFLTGTQWNPVIGREQYGALPFIFGTIVTSVIALVLAVPVSVGLAILLNEGPAGWVRNALAVFVDLLAAIPSVVYGLWAVFVMMPVFDHRVEPFLTSTIGKVPVIGALFQGVPAGGDFFTAGVILAVMILPIVTAVSREVIAVVPNDLREAAWALGATRYETIKMAVLPFARDGIVGASMLGLGRALGETIAVALVIGNSPKIHASLFSAGYTIPAVIANEFREATSSGLHRSALLGLAIVLMLIALAMAVLSRLLVSRAERSLPQEAAPAIEMAAAAG